MSTTHSDADETAGTSRPRVLVLEDEFLIRLTLTEVLEDEGYQVLEAETGDEALGLLAAHPDVALLLTDIQLPGGMDGRTVARRARESRADLPVIFMTGRPDPNDVASPRDVFVAKPYLPSEICTAVKKMLATS